MCEEFLSFIGFFLRDSFADAERIAPGLGCGLIRRVSWLGDLCFFTGLFVSPFLRSLLLSCGRNVSAWWRRRHAN